MSIKYLRITEIFHSLQGETTYIGLPTVFIRLTGCPLRCQYCDTAYAFSGGNKLSIDEILTKVQAYKTKYVTVTGGEPLAQKDAHELISKLCDLGKVVTIETSGAMPIKDVDTRAVRILDLKTPDSKECSRNLYENIDYLKPQDEVKFVICSRGDFDWACEIVAQYRLDELCTVLFSPSFHDIAGATLADWIVESGINVRFQLQLHKILWNDEPGR